MKNVSTKLIGAVFCGLDSPGGNALGRRMKEEALCLRQCFGATSTEKGFKEAALRLKRDNMTEARARAFEVVFAEYDADLWNRYKKAGLDLKNCIAIRWS